MVINYLKIMIQMLVNMVVVSILRQLVKVGIIKYLYIVLDILLLLCYMMLLIYIRIRIYSLMHLVGLLIMLLYIQVHSYVYSDNIKHQLHK
jgi:hypothetical protein